jgi:hypothetical protein
VIGRVVSVFAGESLEVVGLVGFVVGRAASVGFLRLVTLALAQALDLATFSLMVARHGGMAEANPIVGSMFESFGMSAAVLAKLALVVLIGALSVAASARGNRGVWSMVGGLPLALAITAGLIGAITNTATLLR